MNKNAIVVYIDDSEKNIVEFGWLYKSWLMWSINETWDILVFINPSIIEKVKSEYSNDNVHFIEMEPTDTGYGFLNSYGMFEDSANLEIVNKYEYLFKTDCDTFLTEHFAGFKPWKDKVYVGTGMYANVLETSLLIQEKLRAISKALGMNYRGHSHIGASLLAKTSIVVGISKLQVMLTNWLLKNGFPNGPGKWPGWYDGVTALYAHDLAINHNVGPLSLHRGSLDVWCAGNEITTLDLHIHAWLQHADDAFNKVKFHNGELPNIKFGYVPITAGEYCLLIANENVENLIALAKK
jgi:hypothetical protein|tara:strand:- start:425 stop:1309 length:885 start_codon:yes stop_codon:yes gene_type:complete